MCGSEAIVADNTSGGGGNATNAEREENRKFLVCKQSQLSQGYQFVLQLYHQDEEGEGEGGGEGEGEEVQGLLQLTASTSTQQCGCVTQ